MARIILSQETVDALNVSQDYETPPKASGLANNRPGGFHLDDNTERVGDSIETRDPDYRGGSVRSPQSQVAVEDEEDDLYDTSPQAKKRLAQEASAKEISATHSTQILMASQREVVLKKSKVPVATAPSPREQGQSPLAQTQQSNPVQRSYPTDSQPEDQPAVMSTAGKSMKPSAKSLPSRGTRASDPQLSATYKSCTVGASFTKPASSAIERQTDKTASSQQVRKAKKALFASMTAPTLNTTASLANGSAAPMTATQRLEAKKKAKLTTSQPQGPASGAQTNDLVCNAVESLPLGKVDNKQPNKATGSSKLSMQLSTISKPTQKKHQKTVATASKNAKAAEFSIPDASSAVPHASRDRFEAGDFDLPGSPGGHKVRGTKTAANKKRSAAAKVTARQSVNGVKRAAQPSSSVTRSRKQHLKGAASEQDNYGPSQNAREIPKPKARVTRAGARGQVGKPAGAYTERESSGEPEKPSGEQLLQATANSDEDVSVQAPEHKRHSEGNDRVNDKNDDGVSGEPKTLGEQVAAEGARKPPNEAEPKMQISEVAVPEPFQLATANGFTTSARKGASQNVAIVLSDHMQSSSDADLEPADQLIKPRDALRPQQTPATPANMRSSPPLRGAIDRQLRATSRFRDSMGQKPKIIGFSKSGPLNQGSASARKSTLGSAQGSWPSMAIRKVPLAPEGPRGEENVGPRRTNDRSSMAPSVHSARTDRSAVPGNIAKDVTDALAGLLGKSAIPAAPMLPAESTPRNGHVKEVPVATIEPMDDHNDFAAENDFEDPTFVQYEDREVDMDVAQPTRSQVAMPPPPTKQELAPRVPQAPMTQDWVGAYTVSETHSAPAEGSQLKVPAKQAAEVVRLEPPVITHKKPKHVFPKQTEAGHTSIEPSSEVARQHETISKPDNAAGNFVRVVLAPKAVSDPVLLAAPTTCSESLYRRQHKVDRHSSQGGRTVDLHGSPIPTELDVPHNATVLETFSQQAQISSEDDAVLVALTRDKQEANPVKKSPPPKPTRKLSRNAKTVPSQPDTESQAAADMVLGRLDGQYIVRSHRSTEPDPFISSEEAVAQRPQRQGTSAFLNQLMAGVAEYHEDVKNIIENSNEHLPDDEDSDPDKTLVEPELPKRTRRGKSKDYESDSSPSSSDESSASSQGTIVVESDMTAWRNALAPHQANLFDELVGVSHQLVRHLVDRETATQHIVSDYRRRGDNLIKQMQSLHEANKKNHVEALKKRKQAVGNELNRAAGDLGRLKAGIENGLADEPPPKKSRIDAEGALQQALEMYC